MCSSDIVETVVGVFTGGANARLELPDWKKSRVGKSIVKDEEANRRAREASALKDKQLSAAFGMADTKLTGGTGLGPAQKKNLSTPNLLGEA